MSESARTRRLPTQSPLYPRSAPHPHVAQGSDLDPETFQSYVRRQTPLLIKGAIRGWPAFERWSADYFTSMSWPEEKAIAYTEPLEHEFPGWRELTAPAASKQPVSTAEILDRLRGGDTVAARIGFPDDPAALEQLLTDLASFEFPFAPARRRFAQPGLHYASAIVYAYQGGSFTDWHFHPGFEAVMSQVRGTKEVLLLPPDREVWAALTPALDSCAHSFEIAPGAFPAYERLTPTRVRVEPGDSLYIPCWWWHVVEAVDGEFGVTVPHWWGSSSGVRFDFRLPATDYVCWHLLPKALATKEQWRKSPRRQLMRFGMLALLFVTPFPWLTTTFSGSHLGRRPRERDARATL